MNIQILYTKIVDSNFCGIYAFYCLTSHKYYLGRAVDFYDRRQKHNSKLSKQKHDSIHFQSAWNLYGSDSFVCLVIEECSKEIIREREQWYLDN